MTTTRAIETTVFTFDELSDRAKETARDWYRQSASDDFGDFQADSVIDDATRVFQMFGLNINTRPIRLMSGKTRNEPNVYWDLGNGGGVSFAGSYSYVKGSVDAVSREYPSTWTDADGKTHTSDSNQEINRIVRELRDLQRRNFYQLGAGLSHSRSRGVNLRVEDVERSDDKPMTPDAESELTELLRDAADWLHTNLNREMEYQSSEEVIDENIRANEYEFTAEGRVTTSMITRVIVIAVESDGSIRPFFEGVEGFTYQSWRHFFACGIGSFAQGDLIRIVRGLR